MSVTINLSPEQPRLVREKVTGDQDFRPKLGCEESPSRLRSLGVDYSQRYHVGRPAPIKAIARTVARLT